MTWDTRLSLWGLIAAAVLVIGAPLLGAIYLIICMFKGGDEDER